MSKSVGWVVYCAWMGGVLRFPGSCYSQVYLLLYSGSNLGGER